jgi:hypothetical protein
MRAIIATLLLGLAACSPAPAPTNASSPRPAAWLPPWAGRTAPMVVVSRSVLPFCGVEERGIAGAIDPAIRRCFAGALRDHGRAEFASISTTDEGDPIATITRTLPGGGLEVLVDSTQDAFGARVWTQMICPGVVVDALDFGTDFCHEPVVIQ